MFQALCILALFAISSAQEYDEQDNFTRHCGVVDLTDEEFDAAEDHRLTTLQNMKAEDKVSGGTIKVHFHSITNTTGAGAVSKRQIYDQIDVLNGAYNKAGWNFVLASIDVTSNNGWYTVAPSTKEEDAMKRKLRMGTADNLNLYTANIGQGLLGWATFPKDYARSKTNDGVVVHYSTLPGGTFRHVSVSYIIT